MVQHTISRMQPDTLLLHHGLRQAVPMETRLEAVLHEASRSKGSHDRWGLWLIRPRRQAQAIEVVCVDCPLECCQLRLRPLLTMQREGAL